MTSKFRVDLGRFRYFLAVAEALNFRRAAENLHMSQPPLSLQIKHLEEHLGIKLFVRDRKHTELTFAGRALFRSLKDIHGICEQAIEDAKQVAAGERGRLAVGFTDEYMHGGLPKLLGEFQIQYPDVRISSTLKTTPELVEQLLSGLLDLAFVCPPLMTHPIHLHVRALPRTKLNVAVGPRHRLASRRRIYLRQCARERFILPPLQGGTGFFIQLMKLFDAAGFAPNVWHETARAEMATNLVQTGCGITLLTEGAAPRNRAVLPIIHLSDAGAYIQRSAIWNSTRVSPTLAIFLEALATFED